VKGGCDHVRLWLVISCGLASHAAGCHGGTAEVIYESLWF
jgi:hypothetical protein